MDACGLECCDAIERADETGLECRDAIERADETAAARKESYTMCRTILATLVAIAVSQPLSRDHYDRILFHHTRKAGGTSLRTFLAHAANHHGLPIRVREGEMVNETELFGDDRVFTITNLREPTARVWSSYRFEGQWVHGQTEKFSKRTAENHVDFDAWVTRVEEQGKNLRSKRLGRPNALWQCVSNCYCKLFGGTRSLRRILAGNCSRALETLRRFHLVIILERLGDEVYLDRLHAQLSIPHKKMFPRQRTFSGNLSHMDSRIAETMNAMNALDAPLYETIARERREDPGRPDEVP